jgi:hypothetical protein
MRRLRALAALDPEVSAVIAARDARRRSGLGVIVGRLSDNHHIAIPADRAARLLHALASFETFDALADPAQELTEVVSEVLQIVGAALAATQQRA